MNAPALPDPPGDFDVTLIPGLSEWQWRKYWIDRDDQTKRKQWWSIGNDLRRAMRQEPE